MTKLIIQIPCYNEEATLGLTLSELPRQVAGVDEVEWLIINDGSRDRTVEVAQACGVDHIVNLESNQGLAKGFMAGIEASLKAGADIIVNTDADNQYCAADIPKLIAPIFNTFLQLRNFCKNWAVWLCASLAIPRFPMLLAVSALSVVRRH